MARREVAADEFVSGLASLEGGPVTRDRVLDYCTERHIDPASLQRYLHFRPDTYTRNLIWADPVFEVMALCWMPGQRTPIHSHNGQLGWMSMERGALAVINYKWLGCNAADNQNVSGMDCLAGATELELDRREVVECYAGGPIATVDKVQTIHQVVMQGKEPAVSIHIYSRPIESCVAYDLKQRTCWRRTLSFYSRYGEVGLAPADLASAPAPPVEPLIPAERLRRQQ